MSERFIKFIPSEEALYLLKNHPNAFLLLQLIVIRVTRSKNSPNGLQIGEASIGDFRSAGISTEKQYRYAKKILKNLNIISISATRKNGATERATNGTVVKLLNSDIWDLNLNEEGDRKGEPGATEGRPTSGNENDDIHIRRMEKNGKEEKKHTKKTALTLQNPELASSMLAEFFSSLLSAIPSFDEAKLKKTHEQLVAMDKLITKHGEIIIREVFRYAHGSDFWKAHIHTPSKLKDKFETLLIQKQQLKGVLNGKTCQQASNSGTYINGTNVFKARDFSNATAEEIELMFAKKN